MDVAAITLADANDLLAAKLQDLKRETDRKQMEEAALDLNDLLFSAIEYHPTKVNAVKIQTTINTAHDGKGFPHHQSNASGRYKLENFLKAALQTEKLPPRVDYEFIKHLPFAFTTGTHGSGERAAGGSSRPYVEFESLGMDDMYPIFLKINTSHGNGIHGVDAYILPPEIQSIQLVHVPDNTFTPDVIQSIRRTELKAAPTSVDHYLDYRGFYSLGINSKKIPDKKWKEEVLKMLNDGGVKINDETTGLFEHKWGWFNPVAISGFASYHQLKNTTLYEFKDYPLPWCLRKNESEQVVAVAYAIHAHAKKPHRAITTYTGDDIVARLHQIRPKRKF